MASRRVYEFFCLCLLSIFVVSSCESEEFKNLEGAELGILHFSSRELLQFFFPKETIHDNIDPPVIYPSPPNIPTPPVNIPPPTPLITVIPDPTATPIPVPSTNPTSSLSPPSTNPVTQPVITNPPTNPWRGWCVAKSGVPQAALQAALDYACGTGGVDCSVLQQGGSCYNPVTLENHASYAFNSYYQRNPVPTSCDFGGTAMIISTNPSFGACIFPTTSSVPPPFIQIPTQTPPTPSTIPTPPAFPTPPAAPTPPEFYMAPAAPTPPASTTPPVAPTPPTSLRPPAAPSPPVSSPGTTVPRASGYPFSANSTNNSTSVFPMGGFPNIFPIVNTSMPPDSPPSVTSLSKPSTLPQPFIGGVLLLTTIVTWNHILDL